PAGIELAVADDADLSGPLAEPGERLQGPLHLLLPSDDPDQVLHHLLQVLLHLVRALAAGAVERLQGGPGGPLDVCGVDPSGRMFLRELSGITPGPAAEDEQVGERVAAEPVGPV